jgi:hypothetical protein
MTPSTSPTTRPADAPARSEPPARTRSARSSQAPAPANIPVNIQANAAPAGPAATLTVRWLVGRPAAARALPQLVPPTPRTRAVHLEIECTADTARAFLADPVTARRVALPLPAAALSRTEADSLVHLCAPGLLSATLDAAGAVLWARTPAVEALGIPGGRYEREASAPNA